MEEEIDFPKSTDPKSNDLATSTKRLADWTFSLQGVGADLKNLMHEFKTYWRNKMATLPAETSVQSAPTVPVGGVHDSNYQGGITINLGGSTLVVVVLLMTVIGAAAVTMGMDISDRQAFSREFDRRAAQAQRESDQRALLLNEHLQDLQRQYRMTELKLDDWTVVAHRSGLVLPGDYTRGPQGNLDAVSFNQRKGK